MYPGLKVNPIFKDKTGLPLHLQKKHKTFNNEEEILRIKTTA
jgi:hypothetical protein